jgi:hypothetical protein
MEKQIDLNTETNLDTTPFRDLFDTEVVFVGGGEVVVASI